MKSIVGIFFLFCVFVSGFVWAIFPIPTGSGSLTAGDFQKINDHYDSEISVNFLNTTPTAIKLDWQVICKMFNKFSDTQIYDIKTNQIFVVQRTGGVGHADIEPSTESDAQIINNIFSNSQLSRRPVLTNINGVWVASSLRCDFHGYNLITTNSSTGHLCLHFKNSFTDTTKKIDLSHQKTINLALKLSKKHFPQIIQN